MLASSSYGSTVTHKTTECGARGDLAILTGLSPPVSQLGKRRPRAGGEAWSQTHGSTPPAGLMEQGTPHALCTTSHAALRPQPDEAWCTCFLPPPGPLPFFLGVSHSCRGLTPPCLLGAAAWGSGWFIGAGDVIELSGNSSVLWL